MNCHVEDAALWLQSSGMAAAQQRRSNQNHTHAKNHMRYSEEPEEQTLAIATVTYYAERKYVTKQTHA
jgi:hypothetical protein